MPDSEALTKDSELLFDAVREAGALAMTLLRQNVRRWSKSDGSQVTEADLKVDALLGGRLQIARPSYGWLSEETPDSGARMTGRRLWVVDPIDGTSDFINGGEDWCIAAALVEDGRPVIGAVYRPVREEFFWAIAGGGSHLDCLPIRVSDDTSLDGARIMGNRKSLSRSGIVRTYTAIAIQKSCRLNPFRDCLIDVLVVLKFLTIGFMPFGDF